MNQALYESLSKKAAHLMPKDRLNPYDYSLYMKILAELIVRECIAICKDIDGEDNIDARSGRQDCAAEIKEHFGVEQ